MFLITQRGAVRGKASYARCRCGLILSADFLASWPKIQRARLHDNLTLAAGRPGHAGSVGAPKLQVDILEVSRTALLR